MPRPDLSYTTEVAEATAPIYEKVKHIIPAIEWPALAPTIHAINQLKKERNAVILAHNYMTPDIYHGVSDIVGDSLQLAIEATRTDAEVIIQCGVHFMAETSKILSPEKTVLIPDMKAGCSLAESITGADVRATARTQPGYSDHHLCEHVRGREGRMRHLLHVFQCACRWSRVSAPTRCS